MNRLSRLAAIAVCAGAGAAYGAAPSTNPPSTNQHGQRSIEREVRHELLTLSRYTVFDNIGYRVDGSTVTLTGQVVQPVLKDDAGTVVKGIEGVTAVNNQIEVLPLSPMDNGIRRAVFRAIYRDPIMERYGLRSQPTIHIIVKNGHVTLIGLVANQMDKQIAATRANSVPGVFSVADELKIEPNL